MSIEQFGESLLGDIRRRRERQERDLRKQQERQALLGLGINIAAKIGNERLASKTQDFLKKEPFLLGQQAQKTALGYTSQLNNYRSAIQQGGEGYSFGDTIGYAMAQFKPEFEARAKEKLANTYTNDLTTYNAKVRQETRRMAEEWARDYDKAILLADEVLDKDSYSAMVKLNATKANPTNMGDYITRGISSLFGGKSQEEFEEEAFEAITDEMEDAEELNTFMTTFQTFGDMVRAYEFTKDVFPPEAFNADKTKKTVTETKTVEMGDNFYRVEITTEEDLRDPTQSKVTSQKYLDKDENGKRLPVFGPDPKVTAAKELQAQLDIFNPAKLAVQEFRNDGFAEFLRMAQEAGVENPSNPQNAAEYLAVSNVFNTLVTRTTGPGVLNDPSRREIISDSVNIFMTGIMTSEVIKTQMSGKSPEEINSALAEIMRNMYKAAEEAYGKPEFPEFKDYGFVPYPAVETATQQR
jgi:hypothetical protein